MFRTIVVPLDGSAFAEHALGPAIQIAKRSRAALHLVRAHVPYPFELSDGGKWDNRVRHDERQYLARLAAELEGATVAPVTTALLAPTVVESIARYADHADDALLVMTSHGRTGLSRFWLGSVADGVVRHCGAPVLLVRSPSEEMAAPWSAESEPFRRILVPLDGSERAEAILEPVLALAKLAHAALRLVRVVEWAPMPLPVPAGNLDAAVYTAELTELEIARAHEYLGNIATRLRASGELGEITTDVGMGGRAAPSLLEAMESWHPDLVAVATHGRGGSRVLLGSVADKLLHATRVPLLVLRSTTAEQQAALDAAEDEGIETILMS